jgi:hypothetical protein
MTRGRPFEPGNQFGRGRPKGSPNKKAHLAQKIFDHNAPAIMALAINSAPRPAPAANAREPSGTAAAGAADQAGATRAAYARRPRSL